jgi:hypothetical protein
MKRLMRPTKSFRPIRKRWNAVAPLQFLRNIQAGLSEIDAQMRPSCPGRPCPVSQPAFTRSAILLLVFLADAGGHRALRLRVVLSKHQETTKYSLIRTLSFMVFLGSKVGSNWKCFFSPKRD